MRSCIIVVTLACCILAATCCEPAQYQNGCKIYGNSCKCKYGCPSEYIYKTRRDCNNALREMYAAVTAPPPPPQPERSTNICSSLPCLRGYCLQTSNEPGYTCKCDGTGYYGRRCEKACPTMPIAGAVFPHECIVI